MKTFSYKLNFYKFWIVKRFFPELQRNFNSLEKILNLAEREPIRVLVWSTRLKDEGVKIEHPNIKVFRLEDGFIRSVGLGVIYTPPISLVADSRGIYFDSTEPSDLEIILQTTDFSEEILERARNLINLIINFKINKYNLPSSGWKPKKTDKKIIAVVGQVETDRSIKWGSPFVKTNLELLKKVREKNPQEYIVYKPHPDVDGGYKKGAYPDKLILEYADEIVREASSFDICRFADEIHTINSLFGFEALLNRKKVVCYGQPFYGSWGLTVDIYPLLRRKRKLSLEELVAGAIILYPMYVSLISGKKLSPEEAIWEINLIKNKNPLKLKLIQSMQFFIKPIIKISKNLKG